MNESGAVLTPPTTTLASGEDVSSLSCPSFTISDNELLDNVTFWLEGVINCIIASSGLIANIVSAFILSK